MLKLRIENGILGTIFGTILLNLFLGSFLGGYALQYTLGFWLSYIKGTAIFVPFLPCALVGFFFFELIVFATTLTWIASLTF